MPSKVHFKDLETHLLLLLDWVKWIPSGKSLSHSLYNLSGAELYFLVIEATFSHQVRTHFKRNLRVEALTFTLQRLRQFNPHGSRNRLSRTVNFFFVIKADLKLLKSPHVSPWLSEQNWRTVHLREQPNNQHVYCSRPRPFTNWRHRHLKRGNTETAGKLFMQQDQQQVLKTACLLSWVISSSLNNTVNGSSNSCSFKKSFPNRKVSPGKVWMKTSSRWR